MIKLHVDKRIINNIVDYISGLLQCCVDIIIPSNTSVSKILAGGTSNNQSVCAQNGNLLIKLPLCEICKQNDSEIHSFLITDDGLVERHLCKNPNCNKLGFPSHELDVADKDVVASEIIMNIQVYMSPYLPDDDLQALADRLGIHEAFDDRLWYKMLCKYTDEIFEDEILEAREPAIISLYKRFVLDKASNKDKIEEHLSLRGKVRKLNDNQDFRQAIKLAVEDSSMTEAWNASSVEEEKSSKNDNSVAATTHQSQEQQVITSGVSDTSAQSKTTTKQSEELKQPPLKDEAQKKNEAQKQSEALKIKNKIKKLAKPSVKSAKVHKKKPPKTELQELKEEFDDFVA